MSYTGNLFSISRIHKCFQVHAFFSFGKLYETFKERFKVDAAMHDCTTLKTNLFFVFVVDYATILNIDWHRCLNLRFLQPSKYKENNPTSVQHFACDPWNNYQPRLPATIITTHIIRGKVSNWGPRYEISVKPSKTSSMWYKIKMVRTATFLLKQPYKK